MGIISIILGVLLVITGIFCIANPAVTTVAIGLQIGIGLIVAGINGLVFSTKSGHKALSIVLDILTVILGGMIICNFFNLLVATETMALIMGITALVYSILQIVVAVNFKKAGFPWGWTLAAGILGVIAALAIITNPLTGLLVLDFMFAAVIITQGFSLMTLGIMVRKVE